MNYVDYVLKENMKTKICKKPKCLKEKPLSKFGKDKYQKDGLTAHCKECRKENDKEFHKKYPWKRVWYNINERCNNPKSINYKWYGEKGIENHLSLEDVKFLYIRDQAHLMKKPSIDRKNHDKHYELSNCRFIELRKNIAERNIRESSKSILQYDLNGKFIREWRSSMEIERTLKINHSNVIQCCKGNTGYSHAGGFKWKYKLI